MLVRNKKGTGALYSSALPGSAGMAILLYIIRFVSPPPPTLDTIINQHLIQSRNSVRVNASSHAMLREHRINFILINPTSCLVIFLKGGGGVWGSSVSYFICYSWKKYLRLHELLARNGPRQSLLKPIFTWQVHTWKYITESGAFAETWRSSMINYEKPSAL